MADAPVIDFLSSLFSTKPAEPYTHIWLTALPGEGAKDTRSDHKRVEDVTDIEHFVGEHNTHRNLYFKAARFREDCDGARIVDALVFVGAWGDIDIAIKPQAATPAQITMALDALDSMVHKPTMLIASGGGIQPFWHFKVPIVAVTAKDHNRIERLNREIARVFGGDTAQCHPAGGLRLPYTYNLNRRDADGRAVMAKLLRLEPERGHNIDALEQELRGMSAKLFQDKLGQWHTLSGELADVHRVHDSEARAADPIDGSFKPKAPDEWDEILLDMVRKGHRATAITQYAGKLVRMEMSEDDALANIMEKIKESVTRVKAAGGKAQPPGKSEVMAIIRSVMKTDSRKKPLAEDEVSAPRRRRRAKADQPPVSTDTTPPNGEAKLPPLPNLDDPDIAHENVKPEIPIPDPGSFSAARSDAAERATTEEPAHQDQAAPLANDPKTFDPRDAIQVLRQMVSDWYAKDVKGVLVNQGKEFPVQNALYAGTIARGFVAALQQAGHDLRFDGQSQLWLYTDERKTWEPIEFLAAYTLFAKTWQRVTGLNINDRRLVECVRTIMRIAPIMDDAIVWNTPLAQGQHATLFACGTLVLIDRAGALTTRPVTKADMLREMDIPRYAARWTPGARCPRTLRTLAGIMRYIDKVSERKSTARAFLNWASQIFLAAHRPKTLRKAALFVGDHNCGKNTLLEVPRIVVGDEHITSIELTRLNRSFGLQPLLGKRAWLVTEEQAIKQIDGTHLLKQLISCDWMNIERKNADDIHVQPNLLIGFGTNTLPRFSDVSSGLMSRLIYFDLKIRFLPKEAIDPKNSWHTLEIPDIVTTLESERDGIAQLLMRHACAILRSGTMGVTTTMQGVTKELYSNRVRSFIEDAIVRHEGTAGYDMWVSSADLRDAYVGMVNVQDSWAAAGKISFDEKVDVLRQIRNDLRPVVVKKDSKDGEEVTGYRHLQLTVQGVKWLSHGYLYASGRREGLATDFMARASRANRPPGGTITPFAKPTGKPVRQNTLIVAGGTDHKPPPVPPAPPEASD